MPGLIWDLLVGKNTAAPGFLETARAADKAAASTLRATKGVESASARMGKAGAKLTKSLTLPLLAVAGVSVDQAMKFQKSMTLIQTAGGETAKKAAVISAGIKKVAVSTGTSLDQLGEGIYTVAKAGAQKWSAVDQLNVLKAAAQGAKAENVPLAVSVNALTSVMASYGYKASAAVKVQDMLIRGSGLAKTTMQDFANSLSNVVPLASSLHISFAQVAGAISTMTQHGEGAERSTENLSNLITALAGQNNVAAQAMQQLGIKTINLQKNLGKRGLTGTLDIVEKALESKTKGGMVVVKAFKQAQLATGSLQTELKAMPASLAKVSKEFDTGKMSYKDYNTYVKSLGGQQYVLGKNFLATESTAKGFNNALKNGNGDVRTAASTLQKMLGGVTGMRVALMLGGPSAKQFASNVKEVGKAALNSGADVLGWNKTSDTLAVKMDKAKASLQVFAVEIGTALIPAVSKIVGGLTSAVQWFSNLSGTQKKIAAWSAGVLFALGPILTIGGRLVTVGKGLGAFAGAAGSAFARITGGSRTMAATVSRSMMSGLAGAGIGLAVGSLTKNSSTAVKAFGAIGSAAAGAAIGFGVGGPLGAALGGIGGLGGSLAEQWTGQSSAAKESAELSARYLGIENDAANTLLDTLKATNDQYGKQTKTALIQVLQKDGKNAYGPNSILSTGKRMGANQGDIVAAALGGPQSPALNKVYAEIDAFGAKHPGAFSGQDIAKFGNALVAAGKGASDAQDAYQQYMAAQRKGIVTNGQLAKGLGGLNTEFKGTGRNLYDASAAYPITGASAQKNTEIIKENMTAFAANAVAQVKAGKGALLAAAGYEGNVTALKHQLVQMGFNKKAVTDIIAKYKGLPKSFVVAANTAAANAKIDTLQGKIRDIKQGKVPGLTADNTAGKTRIAELQAKIDALRGKSVTVGANTGDAMNKLQALINKIPKGTYHFNVKADQTAHNAQYGPEKLGPTKAAGGAIYGRGTATSDSNLAWLSRGEHVFTASDVNKAGGQGAMYRLRGMIQAGMMRFAGGGSITHSGKDWIYGGVKYASVRAAENARSRAKKTTQSTMSSAASTAIGNIGTAAGAKFYVKDVGIDRIRKQIAKAQKVLDEQVGKGLSKAAASKYSSELSRYAKLAQKQLGALRLKIKGSDLTAVQKAFGGTADDLRSAFSTLLTDVRNAGKSVKPYQTAETKLLADQKSYLAASNRLATMKDFQSGVRSTLAGAFDPTQSGSVTDLISGLKNATGTNNAYTGELGRLRGEAKGNKPLLAFINQLAASGQTATLQTLGSSSKADLANVSKAVASYDTSLSGGAAAATLTKYGTSVDKQTAAVLGMRTDMREFTAAMGTVVKHLARVSTGHSDKQLEKAIAELTDIFHYGRA